MNAIIQRIINRKIEVITVLLVIWQWNFASIFQAYAHPMSQEVIKDAWPKGQKQYPVAYKKKITLTAYSSTPDQTDSTPCITANGFDLCENDEENVLAANFLPFGTKVRIPLHFGETVFTVQDRMNKRYYYRGDIWMKNRQKAKQFGVKFTEIEILKTSDDGR